MTKLYHSIVLMAVMIGGAVPLAVPTANADSLTDALRASLASSKILAAARQGWVAARETIGTKTTTSDLSARLNTTGSGSYADSKNGKGFTESQSISAGITVSKNLFDGGQTRENTRLAEIDLETAGAGYIKVEQSVILDTIEAYLNVIKTRRETVLHTANTARLDAHVAAARIRVEAGAATPTRLAEARARLARAKSDAIAANTRLVNAEDAYKSLTGVDAGDLQQPALLVTLPTSIEEAATAASNHHPDIISARSVERAAAQGFNTLKASVAPTMAFSLSASTKAASGTTNDKDDVTAQLTFSTPILSTNATRSAARRVAASHSQSKLKYREALRAVSVGARQAFRNWQATETRLDAIKSEIEATRLVAKGIASEAQFGQKTTLDLLDAEQDVNDAELRLVTVEHDRLLASFRLLAAVGSLTAADLGLADVLGDLNAMPAPQNPFSTTFPFARRVAAE